MAKAKPIKKPSRLHKNKRQETIYPGRGFFIVLEKAAVPFILLLILLIKIGQLPITLLKYSIHAITYLRSYFLKLGKRSRSYLSLSLSLKKPVLSLALPISIKNPHLKLPKIHLTTPNLTHFQTPSLSIFRFRINLRKLRIKTRISIVTYKIHRTYRLIVNFPHRTRRKFVALLLSIRRQVKRTRLYVLRTFPKKTFIRVSIFFILIAFVWYSSMLLKLSSELPSPYRLSTTMRPLTTQIYDRNGKLLYQFYEGQNRKMIKLEDIPQSLIDATIAIEDKHFYSHPGIDPTGIIRAVRVNYFAQDKTVDSSLQGGSTITQQLIKNTLLNSEKTYDRKIKEIVLAFWTESIYSKKEILQMYFNEAPYGGPAWGVEAAAETYFGKSINEITLAEAAYLAGLPAAPSGYSPYGSNPEKGKQRQLDVLRRMVEDGYITQEQSQLARNEKLTFRPPRQDIQAPHFVMYIRSLLSQKYGERMVSQGGLKVITSLDLDIQKIAEQIVDKQSAALEKLQVGNAAAMVVDTKTGQILAMVGSKDYFDPNGGNFNVTLALRQPGSSIKPITYVTAFEKGYTPGNILLDIPTSFPNPWGQAYTPVNYDGKFHGAVTIRTALGSSYNIPAVKMLSIVSIDDMIKNAHNMGITSLKDRDRYGLSLTLGGGEVRMIDMMSVYNTFATGGIRYQPTALLTVTDSYGNQLENNTIPSGNRVISEEAAYMVNNILSDNNARTPSFGPNSLLKIDSRMVAVKTGTSDDKRDNWTFGYTPEFIVGAWVGNNNNAPMNPTLTSGVTGATPIWHDIMSELISKRPDIAFFRPNTIAEALVDGRKDLIVVGQSQKTLATLRKVKQRNDKDGVEKEIITYSDLFGNFTPGQDKVTR